MPFKRQMGLSICTAALHMCAQLDVLDLLEKESAKINSSCEFLLNSEWIWYKQTYPIGEKLRFRSGWAETQPSRLENVKRSDKQLSGYPIVCQLWVLRTPNLKIFHDYCVKCRAPYLMQCTSCPSMVGSCMCMEGVL